MYRHQGRLRGLGSARRLTSWMSPTRFDAGVASLREHRAYLERPWAANSIPTSSADMAGYVGLGAGCEYAVPFRRYPMG